MALVPVDAIQAPELSETAKQMLEELDYVRGLVLTGNLRGIFITYTADPEELGEDTESVSSVTGATWRVRPGVSHLEMLGLLSQAQYELCSAGQRV